MPRKGGNWNTRPRQMPQARGKAAPKGALALWSRYDPKACTTARTSMLRGKEQREKEAAQEERWTRTKQHSIQP